MEACNHCGSPVSETFVRVFAVDSGDVLACPNCTANAGIAAVATRRAQEK